MCGLNRFVHEGMNHISNVKFLLKTCSGNVNIVLCHLFTVPWVCLQCVIIAFPGHVHLPFGENDHFLPDLYVSISKHTSTACLSYPN